MNIGICLMLPFCQMVMARSESTGNLNSTSYKNKSESRPKQSRLDGTDQAYGSAKNSNKASTFQQDMQTKLLKQLKELSSKIEQLDADGRSCRYGPYSKR
jgi:hypothetical protein